MKKKLLATLLSLVMLLSLLPVSALAAELNDDQKDTLQEILLAQDYTEEEIAELLAEDKIMVIDEDTELDEDFDGLVVLLPGCTLTVKGVKIGVGVVILPGTEEAEEDEEEAKETKVIVSADSEVGTIVVLEEKAEVIIEAEAQVTAIVVEADEAVITVEGTVEALTVNAANVTVSIEAGAEVKTVVVGEDAEEVEIAVSEDAEVGEIEDEGENTTVTEVPAEEEEDDNTPAPVVNTPVEDVFYPFFFPVYEDPWAGDNITCCNNGGKTVSGSDQTTLSVVGD